MTSTLLSKASAPKTSEPLFSGIWIRWQALTVPERFIGANIVLLPVWWVVGLYQFLLPLCLTMIVVYEWHHYGRLRLKQMRLPVAALFALLGYSLLQKVFFSIDISLTGLARMLLGGISFPMLIWYIQSCNIKVRPAVVAWACSVSVLQMIACFLVVHFAFSQPEYVPPRTLYAILTGKSPQLEFGLDGVGTSNYLLLYNFDSSTTMGFARYRFFFGGPEAFAIAAAFIGLLALDIRQRLWSLLLCGASIFLLALSLTRSITLAFLVVLGVRLLYRSGRTWGMALVTGLVAIICFVSLSLPPATNLLVDQYTDTTQAVGELRQGSTETRSEIYLRTLQEIPNRPLLGHGEIGESVVSIGKKAAVGSHSFYLGNLLYQKGLVGAGLYLTFWLSLIAWLYNTRQGRPLCCFLVPLLFSLAWFVMGPQQTETPIILLCLLLRRSIVKTSRSNSACVS